jgi:hypothetical protein
MKLNWESWVYGLFSGFIGGGAGAVSTGFAQVIIDPGHADLKHLLALMGTSFLISGLLTSFAYLKQSPLPVPEQVVAVTTTTQPSSKPQTTTTVVSTGGEPKP